MLESNEKGNSLMNSEKDTQSERKPDDTAGLNMSGHILIRDKNTGEELVNKRNAIHYGNMANMVANALNNAQGAYLQYLAFGNGATSVDTSGRVIYKTPRVSEAYESSASLYSRTYNKIISGGTATDKIEILPGVSYTDIKVTCTLGYDEPNNQDVFDQSTTNEGEYIFDEIGLKSYNPEGENQGLLLTHVIFHPVQKALNRLIQIDYTIRIQSLTSGP